MELLFADGSMDSAEAVYADSPSVKLFNQFVCEAVQGMISDEVSEQTHLRLFEVGGGTGATTTGILPGLVSQSVEYWFTDLSDAFLKRAQMAIARTNTA